MSGRGGDGCSWSDSTRRKRPTLFEEALGLDKDNPEANLGNAWVASEGFDKMAVRVSREGAEAARELSRGA